MYESPKLVPISTINAAYGQGNMTMGLCLTNVNVTANTNVAVNALASVNAGIDVNVAAAANAVAIVLVVKHFSPHGNADPRNRVAGGHPQLPCCGAGTPGGGRSR